MSTSSHHSSLSTVARVMDIASCFKILSLLLLLGGGTVSYLYCVLLQPTWPPSSCPTNFLLATCPWTFLLTLSSRSSPREVIHRQVSSYQINVTPIFFPNFSLRSSHMKPHDATPGEMDGRKVGRRKWRAFPTSTFNTLINWNC